MPRTKLGTIDTANKLILIEKKRITRLSLAEIKLSKVQKIKMAVQTKKRSLIKLRFLFYESN
jgi:hypothetical protein